MICRSKSGDGRRECENCPQRFRNLTYVNYTDYISIDPNIRFGKPCVKGTRIRVFDVVGWLASGMNVSDIIHNYPELSENQIHTCSEYASKHERPKRVMGRLKGKIKMSDDFDEPLEDFEPYM